MFSSLYVWGSCEKFPTEPLKQAGLLPGNAAVPLVAAGRIPLN